MQIGRTVRRAARPGFAIAVLCLQICAFLVGARRAVAGAESANPAALSALVTQAKGKALTARDAAATAKQQIEGLVDRHKQERKTASDEQQEFAKHLQAARAASKRFHAPGQTAPAVPFAAEALEMAFTEAQAAKTHGDTFVQAGKGIVATEAQLSRQTAQAVQEAKTAKDAAAEAKKQVALLKAASSGAAKETADQVTRAQAESGEATAAAASATQSSADATRLADLGPPPAKPRPSKAQRDVAAAESDLNALRQLLATIDGIKKAPVGNGACDIRRIDWQKFHYPNFKLDEPMNERVSTLYGVVYGDLDRNGSLEAFLSISNTAYEGVGGVSEVVYVFAPDARCAVQQLDSFGGSGGKVMGDAYVIGDGADRAEWRLVNGKMVATAQRIP